jgi:protein TIF31
VSGKASVNTATLLFQLAQALALDQDHRAAVNRMRESCNLFRTLLGPEDRNTKEAETWLEQLTQNAVSVEKRAKTQALTGRVRQSNALNGAKTLPQPGQTRAEASGATVSRLGQLEDKRSIQEIMDFINGTGGSSTKKTASRKKRGNPKNRGGANVSVGA